MTSGGDNQGCTKLRCAACVAVLCLGGLALPGVASAHGRAATVALDYRLVLDAGAGRLDGVRASILDGDRSLRLVVERGRRVVVLGDLGEPMLRLDNGVWVNRSSVTAQANRIVSAGRSGWRRVAAGSTFTWHEHRLAPPPFDSASYGKVAGWRVPLVVDGRHTAVAGSFLRVKRPMLWPWALGVAFAVALAAGAMRLRPLLRIPTTIGAGVIAGLAGLSAQTAFALRDDPSGRIAWVFVVATFVIALVAACGLAITHGSWRAYVAGAIGLGAGVLSLSWMPVFLHGAVISALPAQPTRLACAVGLAAGVVSLLGVLWVDPPAEVA